MELRGLALLPDEAARSLIWGWLEAVVEHSDVHANSFTVQNVSSRDTAAFEYFLGQTGGASAVIQHVRLPVNVMPVLVHHGWAEADPNPQRAPAWQRFTGTALAWYRANSGPTDDQVRSNIGRYFLRLDQEHGPGPHRFDADLIAEELGIDEARVRAQTMFLVRSGTLDDTGPGGTHMSSYYQLSRDGYRWAEAGFGSIAALNSTTVQVQVDVRINIRQFLLDLRSTPVPDDVKEEVAEAVDDLQQDPTIEKVGRLMELAANTATLVPLVTKLIVDNAPMFSQLLQHIR